MATQVADLSVEELRRVIQDTVRATIEDFLRDPDEGLELRAELQTRLAQSVKEVHEGGITYSADEVAAKLGLTW
jgi:hypothetical protein